MKPFLLTILSVVAIHSLSFAHADDILGVWKNASGKGYVEIYKEGSKDYGKLVWLKKTHDEKGMPYLDTKNPDKTNCTKPLLGLVMLRDFLFDDGAWSGGKANKSPY